MTTEVGPLSVEEMLARSKAAVAAGVPAGGSKIQQMLAGREDASDTVDLSPVARLLKAQESQKKSEIPFTEQDWYINAKVAQLRGQIELYSNLPGLDPSGAIMDSLEKEVFSLVNKQQAKLKASQAEADAKKAELDRLEAEKAAAPMSAEDMLKRAKNSVDGISTPISISKEVQALLDKSKGAVVNQTA